MTDFLTALLTPIIAGIAVYIAYQQWLTNRLRLDLDLYDRRLRLYQATIEYIDGVIARLNPTLEVISTFRRSTAEVDFLFGPDIRKYLDELFHRGINLRHWASQYRDRTQTPPPGYDHAEVVEGKAKESQWFAKQHEEAHRRFKKYLNLTDRQSACKFW